MVQMNEDSSEQMSQDFGVSNDMQKERCEEHIQENLMQDMLNLLSDSVSVGIIASYLDAGDLPPFYINDKLLSIIGGYTRKEFFNMMREDSFAVVHPDDKKRTQKEILEQTEISGEYEVQYRLMQKGGNILWISEHGKSTIHEGREVLLAAFVDITNVVQLRQEAERKNEIIFAGQQYARRLQNNMLPRENAFERVFADYSVLWSPKDIVGGDVYWLKTFSQGSLLAVCDCTGHGTSGAMLTMLALSVLDASVTQENYQNLQEIMVEFDQRGAEILCANANDYAKEGILALHDGCDIALLFIGNDGDITFASANIPLFVCDGKTVTTLRGQRFFVGEGRLTKHDKVRVTKIPYNPNNTYYVASDGLFDQIGGDALIPMGTKPFKELILKYYGTKQKGISEKVWQSFEAYRGEEIRRDDVVLLSFQTKR